MLSYPTGTQFKDNSEKGTALIEVQCPLGNRLSFYLPDGTKVWLNGGSVIKYSNGFLDNRYTELSGEAYFKVESDSSNPFYVKTGEISVKVTGTEFNVNSYKENNTIEVVLVEGKVEISIKENDVLLEMLPNQKVSYDKTIHNYHVQKVDVKNYNEWIKGNLVFRDLSLEEVATELERWYDIDIEILDEELKQLRYHACFTDEGLIEVLNLLKSTSTMNYKIQDIDTDKNGDVKRKKVLFFK